MDSKKEPKKSIKGQKSLLKKTYLYGMINREAICITDKADFLNEYTIAYLMNNYTI